MSSLSNLSISELETLADARLTNLRRAKSEMAELLTELLDRNCTDACRVMDILEGKTTEKV